MTNYDLVIRGGTVVTASDTVKADVGIRSGTIVALADALTGGAKEIDATGLLVMPGGIDSHVHLAQHAWSGASSWPMVSRAARARRSRAATPPILPFAIQPRGASLA